MSFDIHQFDEIGSDTEDVSDAFHEYQCTLTEMFESSSKKFREHSEKYVDSGMSPDFWIMQMMHYAFEYIGSAPAQITTDDIHELCTDIFPRKITLSDREEAEYAIAELIMFWEFLKDEFQLANADAIIAELQDAEASFIDNMFDSSKFGMAKSLLSMGADSGYDMDSQEGIEAFMKSYNAGIEAENQSAEGISGSFPPIPQYNHQETYVRSEKKIGRNAPCPCGSGKKYKKCCG